MNRLRGIFMRAVFRALRMAGFEDAAWRIAEREMERSMGRIEGGKKK
jgi:hypothetical protein